MLHVTWLYKYQYSMWDAGNPSIFPKEPKNGSAKYTPITNNIGIGGMVYDTLWVVLKH